MKVLDHPNLLRYIDMLQSPRHLYIVLEFAEHGQLFDYLVTYRQLAYPVALSFFRSIIYGVEFLHSHSICHRDLKPENVLLDEFDQVKISDFGLARWMRSNIAETKCGTPYYTAPEVLRGVPYDGRAADIWSCGVILFALLAGRLPFDDRSFRVLIAKVKGGQFVMPEFDLRIQNLIASMLTVDPDDRIKLAAVKQHEAFRLDVASPNYRSPMTRPLNVRTDPVDISTVDEESLRLLRAFAYQSDADVLSELQAVGKTNAKRFWQLLNRDPGRVERWGSVANHETVEPIPMSAQFISEETPVGERDHFQRWRRKSDRPSLEAYSMANPADFLGALSRGDASEVVRVIGYPDRLEEVMGRVQEILNRAGFMLDYPNPRDLYALHADAPVELHCRIEYTGVRAVLLTIRLVSGDEDFFEKEVDEIESALRYGG
jgi:BR serine/threonine kinase